MNKKFLIPISITVVLILITVFSVVYKTTSNDDRYKQEEVETLAPKETDKIEVKRESNNSESKDLDFEPPKSVVVDEDGNIMSESEAEAFEESIADTLKLEEKEIDGKKVTVDGAGSPIGRSEEKEDTQKEVDDTVMEEMQKSVEEYSYNKTMSDLKQFISIQVKRQQEAGNTEFNGITEESIANASNEEIEDLYTKIMDTVGWER